MIDPSLLKAIVRVQTRRAGAGDTPFVEALYREMTTTFLPPESENDARRRFLDGYRLGLSWIVMLESQAIGWLQVEDGPDEVVLSQIHLLPAFRNLGIGGRLVEALIGQARSEAKAIGLQVLEGNPALALYVRLGFEVVGHGDNRFHMRWRPEPPPGADGPSR